MFWDTFLSTLPLEISRQLPSKQIEKPLHTLVATDVDLLLSGTVVYEMVTATSFFAVDSINGKFYF